MEVAVTNYGCAILSIMVPDKNGKFANVILGHDSIEHVINSPEPFLSTTIGRYGNRIANGKFTLYGEEHQLTVNNGPNSLHGGPTGSMPAYGMRFSPMNRPSFSIIRLPTVKRLPRYFRNRNDISSGR